MNRIVGFIICAVALATAGSSTALGDDLIVTSFSDFAGQTNIVLQATGNITFSGGSLNLPALPPGASSGLLSVEAGNDIIIEDGTSILAGPGWSLSLLAGADVTLGIDSFLNVSTGDMTIQAGGQIVNNGSGTTDPGGTITIGGGGQGSIGILQPGPAVPIGPPAQLIILNSQINGANITAVAGTNVLFVFSPDDNTRFNDFASGRFQWFKNGRKLCGETNGILSLTSIRLADAGNYSIIVSNRGSRTRNVSLRILQPSHNADPRHLHYSSQHQPR